VPEDDEGTEGDGAQQRHHHLAVDHELGGAVHPGRLAQGLGHRPQAGQVERHDVARHLPDGGQGDGSDPPRRCGVPRVDQPIEADLVEEEVEAAEAVACGGVHQPSPYHPGDDERDRHREQEQAAIEALGPDALVEEDGETETDEQASQHEDDREDGRVANVDVEAGVVGETAEVVDSNERVVGKQALPGAHRHPGRPGDEPVDEDHHCDDRRQHEQESCRAVPLEPAQPREPRSVSWRRLRGGDLHHFPFRLSQELARPFCEGASQLSVSLFPVYWLGDAAAAAASAIWNASTF